MKICTICGKNDTELKFYSKNKCSKCKNKEDSKRRAEKAGREYNPRETIDIPDGYKQCSNCKQVLLLDNFYVLGTKNKDGKNKIYSRCKECERKIVLEHPNRQKYIEISNDNKNIKRKEDSDYNDYLNGLNSKYLNSKNGIITHMLSAAKKRAKKNNLDFNLVKEDIILPTHCPILGIELVKGTKDDYSKTYSLDRIDNLRGYVVGNVQVISMLANSMKNSATEEQLLTFSKNIENYLNNRLNE